MSQVPGTTLVTSGFTYQIIILSPKVSLGSPSKEGDRVGERRFLSNLLRRALRVTKILQQIRGQTVALPEQLVPYKTTRPFVPKLCALVRLN